MTIKTLCFWMKGSSTAQLLRDRIDDMLEKGTEEVSVRDFQLQLREAHERLHGDMIPNMHALRNILARGESDRDQMAAIIGSLKKSLGN